MSMETAGRIVEARGEPQEPDAALCKFYGVDGWAALVGAMEQHVIRLQDAARRNVKPWEDTFPPTLLPKYLRVSGLAAQPEKDATGRTPQDYAIEQAGYMAKAGEQLLEAINEQADLLIRREESDDIEANTIEAAGEAVSDAMSSLRLQIYEFRKRRDRALRYPAPAAQKVGK